MENWETKPPRLQVASVVTASTVPPPKKKGGPCGDGARRKPSTPGMTENKKKGKNSSSGPLHPGGLPDGPRGAPGPVRTPGDDGGGRGGLPDGAAGGGDHLQDQPGVQGEPKLVPHGQFS